MSVRIQIEVPATSANLGPGYDSFGLALGMVLIPVATRVIGPMIGAVRGLLGRSAVSDG